MYHTCSRCFAQMVSICFLNINQPQHWVQPLNIGAGDNDPAQKLVSVNKICHSSRCVSSSDGKQPWTIPEFLSSASPFFLGYPQESQRRTYPSLQNLQTAKKRHIRGDRKRENKYAKMENSPCCRHLLGDPRAKPSWDQCWISTVEPKTLATVSQLILVTW